MLDKNTRKPSLLTVSDDVPDVALDYLSILFQVADAVLES
jgi:hypothetical protein